MARLDVAAPPSVGSRVLLDRKAATVRRVYPDRGLVVVVYEEGATMAWVPLDACNQDGLDAIGRKVRTVIRRESIAAAKIAYRELRSRPTLQVHCVRRPQARGTVRRRVAVRRTCGATRDGPSRSTDDDEPSSPLVGHDVSERS